MKLFPEINDSVVSLCVHRPCSDTFCSILQIMSLHLRYISFLWQVADLGCNLNMPQLRDGARVLMKLMPPGIHSAAYNIIVDQYTPRQCYLNIYVFLLQITLQWKI